MHNTSESGNALWFILIAIVLLGSLTVMLSRGSDSTGDTGDFERTQIQATEVLRYASGIEQAVQRLIAQAGCSENELSFENSVISGYSNTNSPTNNSCHIFDVAGAGMTWRSPPNGISDGTEWIINGRNTVLDIGCNTNNASCTELLIMLPGITESGCIQLNRTLDVENPSGAPPADSNSLIDTGTLFQGSFAYAQTISDTGSVLSYENSACVESTSDNFLFYHTLIKR